MIFVLNNNFTSSVLRGEHIAQALGAKCYFGDLCGTRNSNVVIVKDADRGLVEDAKERGNQIYLDVIDLFCYKDRTCVFADLVDVVIVPNRACIEFYKDHFPRARYAVIPHQWDHRLRGSAPQDYCRTAYIGKVFNKPECWAGQSVMTSAQFLQAAPLFNLHLALQPRNPKAALLKPSTKISTAAAVGANAVSWNDPGAVELLGWDYPYIFTETWNPSEAIQYAQKTFGSPTWKRAREQMKDVKAATSLQAVTALYRRLDDGDETMLVAVKLQNRMAA